MKTLGRTPKKLTDYTREDYNRVLNKKQPNKKGDGLYNNALNSRKYNVADREREKEGLYKPQMADHSREVSPAIRSYMKKKGITDVNEAKRRYAKGEALVKKQQQRAKEVAPKRQTVDLGQKLESRGAGTLNSEFGNASIKRVTREAPAPKLTAKDIKKNAKNQIKGIKAVAKAEKKDMKLADKKAKSDARNAAVAKRTSERNAAKTARAAGKAALQEARTASKAQRITEKYNKKINKLKGANIAKKGGKLCKKC